MWKRPEPDEDKLEEMNRVIQEAMSAQRLVTLKLYDPMGLRNVNLMPTRVERDQLKGYNVNGKLVASELGVIVDVVEIE